MSREGNQSMKKRILHVGEAHYLSTGYSTYALEVLKRLHASGKYDVVELASYANPGDVRGQNVPWGFVPVMPANEQEGEVYNSQMPGSQFGEWKFEQTLLDFPADCVFAERDPWYDSFIRWSPFRPHFNWAWMPTVDAEPQQNEWIDLCLNADAVFTYNDWSLDVLKKQSQGRIKTVCSAPPGADLDAFKINPDKAGLRQSMGLEGDIYIIGTVMRNQRRKLFPDLIEAFAEFLNTAPAELAKRSYLYLHTAWPDLGWDIPALLTEFGVSNRTLMTYACKACGTVFPSLFCDSQTGCPRCGKFAATFPESGSGISREVLSDIYNLFDVYVQYATNEGFGMPQVEAAACGLPVFSTDYSAMSDAVRKIKGFPIKVKRFVRESETGRKFAYPDNADLVKNITDFLILPESVRRIKGFEARKAVEEHYTWDKTAKIWMDYFDSIEPSRTWNSPANIHTPQTQIPPNLSNEDFVKWGLIYCAGRPDLLGSYLAIRMLRDLNWGCVIQTGNENTYLNEQSWLGGMKRKQPFGREQAMEQFLVLANKKNHWETLRVRRFCK